jgi:hypothetical protein
MRLVPCRSWKLALKVGTAELLVNLCSSDKSGLGLISMWSFVWFSETHV